MPAIGNNEHTLLQGLSDFWIRFYKDVDELQAMYRSTEVLMAQTYLDMLSAFLNISVTETPIFNLEYFKLLSVREDNVVFDVAALAADNRHRYVLPDNVVEAHILQNKVIDPTASLEVYAGYETDPDLLELRFEEDPSGQPGRVLGSTTIGEVAIFGNGSLTRFFVASGGPFEKAKPGHWLRLTNSGSGNDKTYKIDRVISNNEVLLQAALTLPDANSGSLVGELIDSEFTPLEGYAQRIVTVAMGGSFDDATERAGTDVGSWWAESPVGLGVRKGDILRVSDIAAVPSIPADFTIDLVRHNKLYLATETPVLRDATGITDYAILREGPEPDVEGEELTFAQENQDKTDTDGTIASGDVLTTVSAPFAATDRQRFLTIKNGGAITWTATLAADGTLTRTGGMSNVLVRAAVGGTVTITGSGLGNDGQYRIDDITSVDDGRVLGTFLGEAGLSVTLDNVTNSGTYRIRSVPGPPWDTLQTATPMAYPDPNNSSLEWEVHDGYRVSLAHFRVVRDSLVLQAGVGSNFTGGRHAPVEGQDYVVDYEIGKLTQVGRNAGTWSTAPLAPALARAAYTWLEEILVVTTGAGELSTADVEVRVSEVAFWAPDVQVDRFNLYNNYGYLINRFEASSETYREFIRGVFQLYIMGPTMERIESALNVVAGFQVIRDDGEVLTAVDTTSDPDFELITTTRLNGDTAVYRLAKGAPLRADVLDPTSIDTLTFESFEPLTIAFLVTDYVQDPTWWTDIVIPRELMPEESLSRRRTLPVLVENVIGAYDDPHIGDPGFFIGADDEGNTPPFIATDPALRRKMANVAMNEFLKWHIFFVSFDASLQNIIDPDFVTDLTELIIVGKPAYKFLYIEPFNSFTDTLRIVESTLEVDSTITFEDTMILGEDSLTIQSFSWNIGDVWRYNTPVTGETVATSPPAVGTPISLANDHLITKTVSGPSVLREDVDYEMDYAAGKITPLTTWPAGTFTIDYHNIILTAQASKDASLGDTDYVIGGLDPEKIRTRREPFTQGTIALAGVQAKGLTDPEATFDATLHAGVRIRIISPASVAGFYDTIRVASKNTIVLRGTSIPNATGVQWAFISEEPTDGQIQQVGSDWVLDTPSGMFRKSVISRHIGRYVRIKNASNLANNGRHRIKEVREMWRVVLDATLVAESNIHWRLEGTDQQMDLVERPLQITVS